MQQKTHTGKKPYNCSHSNMALTIKSNLITHARTPTTEDKSYSWSHCNKAFANKGPL